MSQILGIHHVTAIASDPQRNVDFYAGLLGLRLVKRTVNFDDPLSYHLYYGDEVGHPGSLLTFFPWPDARRGRHGHGAVGVTALSIVPSAIGFWVERLRRHGVAYDGPMSRGSGDEAEEVIAFVDDDGLRLELVGQSFAVRRPAWGGAPGIAIDHAVRGLHSVTLWVADAEETERVLTDTLGFRRLGTIGAVQRFTTGAGGPGTFVDVTTIAGAVEAVGGAGTVHHVAFSVADDAVELAVRERVAAATLNPTPVIDRTYFRSVYFREPQGILFELATVPPGFAIDESVAHLGERLMLPPQYAVQRDEIEAVLPHIDLPISPSAESALASVPEDEHHDTLGFIHRYIPPSDARTGSATLVLLHGTGGDEDDLLPLGRALLPGAGMLSPRGKVLERGAARFFRRLKEGVFDQEDLARRTEELAAFIDHAADRYLFARDEIIAVGFSNGANIAASLLLRRPGVLHGAVLLSPMVPFKMSSLPDLNGTSVFIGAGRNDPIVPADDAERLAAMLERAGADVTLYWTNAGHETSDSEIAEAKRHIARWIASTAHR